MVGMPWFRASMPSSWTSTPAAMPGIRRRPIQTTFRRGRPAPAGASESETTAVKYDVLSADG